MRRQHLVAFAGVGVAAVGVAAGIRFVLAHQAAIARRRIGKPLGERSIVAVRVGRRALGGEPIEGLVLGEALAAGLGAERRKQTLGGRLAKGMARRLGWPVHLRTAAIVGSESPDLAAQLADLPEGYAPHVAVIVVGGNDVTHRIPVAVSTQHLRDAILRLRRRGTEVVVGTCPDLGALRPVPQPLRRLVSSMSRRLAEAQTETALAAGARPVDLRRAVGPMFFDDPDAMFSMDRFHPSALGYRRTAEALLPTACLAAEAALSSRRQVPR